MPMIALSEFERYDVRLTSSYLCWAGRARDPESQRCVRGTCVAFAEARKSGTADEIQTRNRNTKSERNKQRAERFY